MLQPTGGDVKVLVVEDEVKIARSIERALEQESFAVDVCYDGTSAAKNIENESYDVAIIDRMIPGSHNGIELIEMMRTAKLFTPVIVLSALKSTEDKTAGLYAGADDYLVKPFAIEELIARVRALLRRPATQHSSVLTCGDLSVNTTTREVFRSSKRIDLTTKEYAILEFMIRNCDTPLSKEQIIEHAWDSDADVQLNTVEVYMKYLRNKIDKPFKKNLIHTAYGIGYRLGPK